MWCAQHDETTLAPAKARSYELPSFSGSESVGITLLLMSIENPSEDIITAVHGAVQWFGNNKIEGIKLEREIDLGLLKPSDLELISFDKDSQSYFIKDWFLFSIFIDFNIHLFEKKPFPQIELSRGRQNLLTVAIAQAKKSGAPKKENYWNSTSKNNENIKETGV